MSWITDLLYGWWLYLGLVWSVVLAISGCAAIIGLRAGVTENPSGGLSLLLGMIAGPVLVLAGGAAAIGFGLEKVGVASYAGAHTDTFKVLYRHFLWQFFDMVPEVGIWKVLRIEDPAVEAGLYDGLLLIAYKIFVIYVVLATVKTLLKD